MRVRHGGELADCVDDLLETERSRIENDDSWTSRVKLSHGGIIIITPNHLVGHRGGINPLAQLGMATGHPCCRIGNQQHTHMRVRRHDGGDVPTFRDDAPGGAGDELTLPAYQLSADVKIGSDRTHRGGHVRMPDSFGHVVSVDSDGGGLWIG